MFNRKDFIEIGFIGKTRGISGELNLNFTKGLLREAEFYTWFYIEYDGYLVPYKIIQLKYKSESEGIVLFEDSTQEDVKDIIGKRIFIKLNETSSNTSPLDSYEVLIDFEVFDQKKIKVGTVTDILENPNNLNLVVEKDGNEVYIPLNEELILDFSMENKQIHLKIPDGLLDLF